MKLIRNIFVTAAMVLVAGVVHADGDENKTAFQKVKGDLSVMILGSGGPIATAEGRASAGYLIFTDGKPRVLMDVGGGTYQRLATSGTNIKDLDTILLSHLHADHTGDLVPVMKTIYFHNNLARNQAAAQGITLLGRTAPINIYGPAASALPAATRGVSYKLPNDTLVPIYPSTKDYADGQFSIGKGGVDRYLKAFVAGISDDDGPMGPGGPVSNFNYKGFDLSSNVAAVELNPQFQLQPFYSKDGLEITAIAVDHGPVPAVAFRIDYKGHSVVYSGDTGTKGRGPMQFGQGNMAMLSQDADMLIYDTAVMDKGGLPANPLFHILHTQPSLIAGVAIKANVKTLVLSHLTPVTSPRVDAIVDIIKSKGFLGKIKKAKDLKVYNFGDDD